LRFNVWREDFNACFPTAPDSNSFWHILKDHPCHNGAQAVWNVQDVNCDSLPRMDKCDPPQCSKDTVLRKAIQRAIGYGMTYVEIYKIDIADTLAGTLQNEADSIEAKGLYCFPQGGVQKTPLNSEATLLNDFSWSLYPNPANDKINIQVTSTQENMQFALSDVSGKVFKNITFNASGNTTIIVDTSVLPAGIYFASVKGINGGFKVKKIVIIK
jgi:hypothetical protein